jgi:hypothetical protein
MDHDLIPSPVISHVEEDSLTNKPQGTSPVTYKPKTTLHMEEEPQTTANIEDKHQTAPPKEKDPQTDTPQNHDTYSTLPKNQDTQIESPKKPDTQTDAPVKKDIQVDLPEKQDTQIDSSEKKDTQTDSHEEQDTHIALVPSMDNIQSTSTATDTKGEPVKKREKKPMEIYSDNLKNVAYYWLSSWYEKKPRYYMNGRSFWERVYRGIFWLAQNPKVPGKSQK